MPNKNAKNPARSVQVVTFYRFMSLTAERLEAFRQWLAPKANDLDLRGLFIVGAEGVNCTFSIPWQNAENFKVEVADFFDLPVSEIFFKDSFADKHPFHDLSIKIRAEIVTLERPDLAPHITPLAENRHLSPAQWDHAIENDDVVVIDTRNSYEFEIGHFKGAIDPKTREFTEFPKWLKHQNISKDQKVLIYCTGGIRCEKAILEMKEQGFHNVYQLDGGILNYLNQSPHRNFTGECFVFDYRVAVDQELAPSKSYKLCPHCGQPAKEKVTCVQCGVGAIVCNHCLEKDQQFKTCSKNCAHHYRMGHRSKKIHHDAFRARQLREMARISN